MKTIFAASLLICMTTPALADQCQWLPVDQAISAAENLMTAKKIQHFCELCGDTAPQDITLRTISMQRPEEGFREILINAQAIDAAYTYVDGANLALKIGCPVTDVSPTI